MSESSDLPNFQGTCLPAHGFVSGERIKLRGLLRNILWSPTQLPAPNSNHRLFDSGALPLRIISILSLPRTSDEVLQVFLQNTSNTLREVVITVEIAKQIKEGCISYSFDCTANSCYPRKAKNIREECNTDIRVNLRDENDTRAKEFCDALDWDDILKVLQRATYVRWDEGGEKRPFLHRFALGNIAPSIFPADIFSLTPDY